MHQYEKKNNIYTEIHTSNQPLEPEIPVADPRTNHKESFLDLIDIEEEVGNMKKSLVKIWQLKEIEEPSHQSIQKPMKSRNCSHLNLLTPQCREDQPIEKTAL